MTDAKSADWGAFLQRCQRQIELGETLPLYGRVTRVAGLVMEAVGLRLPVGSPCHVPLTSGFRLEAEVVGFEQERLFLMPLGDVEGVQPGAPVIPTLAAQAAPRLYERRHRIRPPSDGRHLPVGDALLGRALDVGVRAINSMLTVGRGQRMGLFAGSGVGKSVLLGMMARYTAADVIVVGLIGERGREVKEFIEQILGPQGLARSVVVAAPADNPPLLRLQGAAYTTLIAEHFRDQGKNVLLIMDSLTRYAMAQREIALAIGEPPATKGYPPSVFAKLPALVERAGNGRVGGGSITAFYTVLTEGDDQQDPIADSARAILDGHIVLNRVLAEAGHYPAIDVEQSISRAMHNITDETHQKLTRRLKQLMSRYQRNRDLINVGAYSPGSDPLIDEAIARHSQIEKFLQQSINERAGIAQSLRELSALFN
jgi:flagellum-specific ATP synthase